MPRRPLSFAALALLPAALSLTLALAQPPRAEGEVAEEFEWKGEKRTRKVLVLDLGGGERLELVRLPGGRSRWAARRPT